MNINSITPDFKNKNVMVIGDIMLDQYIFGKSERISPEAPVAIMKYKNESYSLGGAGNVALNIFELGAKPFLIGTIGNDDEGKKIKNIVDQSGLRSSGLFLNKNKPTTVKSRIISTNQQLLRIDKENTKSISKEIEEKIIKYVKKLIKNNRPNALILSDYRKGLLTDNLLKQLISLCKKNKIFIAVDPKGSNFQKYKGANLITPNLKETEVVYGGRIVNDINLNKAISVIKKQTECDCVVVTKGKEGISYKFNNSKIKSLSSNAKEVFDVTGAGDTFISAFTLAYVSSDSWDVAAKIANIAAGLIVTKLGAAQISQDEILNEISTDLNFKKILSLKELTQELKKHKANGKTVVFTNGCFDLFHQGHLTILKKSKELGDILIVAINSDSSVKKLKGKPRPLTNEKFRANLLSSLDFIDYVTVFSEDTPLKVIKEIKPDILTKGSDYKKEDVVGKEFIESYNGKIVLIPLEKTFSTTNLINSIKNK
ncbi:MAG: D-glycero-beta-D-manno-heptose-7-phosphate kinase [Candidatus Dadabacteria bacterium]|nr:D-glycero-beta-D-manno-heptose-7-phosphate kinase [Candidatus Dadabacteria bacterium]NIQ12928.1 D-glycero-beta-D-manno-heptose-7-phosphate kinase [Candidatus Dadabacteria bacterium]